jgi:hypothetical protein
MIERLEQRAPDQIVLSKEALLGERRIGRLRDADPEELSRIVPLVERLRRVDALVALEPDQPRVEHLGERLRRLGLADARLSFEEQRLRQAQREEERGREPIVGQVVDVAQSGLERLDVGHRRAHRVDGARVGGPRHAASPSPSTAR